MRSLLFSSILGLAVLASCSKKEDAKVERLSDKVPTITIDELDAKLAANDCQAVDANGDGTRKKMGTLPGAVLLSDSETFNVAELPADKAKELVFYCANTRCGASHEAAETALTAGYRNVKVMPDGIAGWVKAGKQVQRL